MNFGSKGTANNPCWAICAARASINYQPFNCVIDECYVHLPGGSTTAGTIGFYMDALELDTVAHHSLCVIRNCRADFTEGGGVNLSTYYMGIAAGGGIGTIVENNQIQNCRWGISWGCAGSTIDLVIRGNNFTDVAMVFADGLRSDLQTSPVVERIILLNNTAEWPTAANFGAAIGMKFSAGASSSTAIFKNVIARANVFRRPAGTSPGGSEYGLSFQNCTSVIAENNVVDVSAANNAFVYYSATCVSVKAFNTRKPDSTFVPAYNTTTSLHLPELTTDVEDALLAI